MANKFNKTSSIPIDFVCKIPGFETLEVARPQPANKFLPSWWKDTPIDTIKTPHSYFIDEHLTVKACPSFPEYLSNGYILPMWADSVLYYSEESDTWQTRIGDNAGWENYNISAHSNFQFNNHADVSMQGVPSSLTFKFTSPWSIFTPKGYSVMQLPLFYHFNKEFSALPGIIHSDIMHQIFLQVAYQGTGTEIYIPQGTPVVQYIPFKRDTTFKLTVRGETEEDRFEQSKIRTILHSRFPGKGVYKKLKRSVDLI